MRERIAVPSTKLRGASSARSWRLWAAVEVETESEEGFGLGKPQTGREQAFEERVVELKRVATTVKGGRQISFRAVMVVGDGAGTVGVGNASAKEIPKACRKAAKKAKRDVITVPLSRYSLSFPHRQEAKFSAAKVMLRPAAEGTGADFFNLCKNTKRDLGVIAGGAVRTVLEVAGVKNGFGKILNSGNAMNNAKATIKALSMMRTARQVADARGVSVDFILGKTSDPTPRPRTPEPEAEDPTALMEDPMTESSIDASFSESEREEDEEMEDEESETEDEESEMEDEEV